MNNEKPVMIITGTRRGIGKGIAEHYIDQGYNVIGCSRGRGTISAENYQHEQVDLIDDKQVRNFVRTIKKQYKKIDILVCNVGLVASVLHMSLTSTESLNDFINSNFVANYLICREVSKVMVSNRSGRIITLSSIMTSIHAPGTSAYSSTKKALEEMTKVLAEELAPQAITCNSVALSVMMTETVKDLGQEWLERMYEMQSIKRPLLISELCHTISFLASPNASAVTGQVINLCKVN